MMIICLSVLPSFASAAIVKKTDDFTQWYEKSSSPESTFSGKSVGKTYIFGKHVVADLGAEYSVKHVNYYAQGGLDGGYITFLDAKFNEVYRTDLRGRPAEGKINVSVKARYVSIGHNTYGSSNALKMFTYDVYVDDGKVSDVSELNVKAEINKVELTWKNPVEDGFNGVKIYRDDALIKVLDKSETSYVVNDLKDNTMYNFKVSSLDASNVETKGVTTSVRTLVDPKKIPPGPVSSFTAEATDKTVKLKWKSPKDDDLAGFKILQNGKQVAEIGLEEEFTVKNLKPLTDYTFGVMAVDKDKNDSTPVNLSIRTLEENDDEPPLVPSNVFAKPSNGALIATWDRVSDKDLAGYNVYLDDKKINSNLISSTNFTIKNLENNRKYKIQVQAVDRSGNASALSLAAYGTPDERTLPIIESKYSLQDVSDGVGVMFGQFWTVLAFAVGIPLAFYIIYKLKLTVLP